MSYPAMLDVPPRLVEWIVSLLRCAPRRRWRRLSARDQVILALVYLRKGETFTVLAAGFGIGVATCHRYVNEVVAVLKRRKVPLEQALRSKRGRGGILILDGTLVACDRLWSPQGAPAANFSGKHHREGVNVQALTNHRGDLVWLSGPLPGKTHDVAAARTHGIIDATIGRFVLADKAYIGAGEHILTGYRRPYRHRLDKKISTRRARTRAPGERVFATLKTWRCLRKLRISPNRAAAYLAAIAVCINYTT